MDAFWGGRFDFVRLFDVVLSQIVGGNAEALAQDHDFSDFGKCDAVLPSKGFHFVGFWDPKASFELLGRIILTGNWGKLNGHLLFRLGLQQERHDPILR